MKVSVNDKTVLLFPTALVVNRLFAGIIRRKLRKEGVKLSRKQTVKLIKAFRKYRKKHPDWVFVDAVSASGAHVTAIL